MSDQQTEPTAWWWDLRNRRAVTTEERGPDLDVLGPYPTRAEAEAWQERHTAREEAWKEEDERWEGEDDDEPGGARP